MREVRPELTSREREEFQNELTYAKVQAEYQLKFKELELEIKRQEVRWTQVLRLPSAIIMLPVRFLFGIGYIAHAVRGTTPSEKFWDYLTKI